MLVIIKFNYLNFKFTVNSKFIFINLTYYFFHFQQQYLKWSGLSNLKGHYCYKFVTRFIMAFITI